MSQYPQNYPPPPQQQQPPQQPPIGYMPPMGPPADPRSPGRRAGALMIVVGSLGLLCGVCLGGVSLMPIEQMMAKSGQRPPLPPGMSLSTFVMAMKVTAAFVLIGAAAELMLGIGVRRGGAGITTIALVFTGVAVAYFVLNTVGSVLMSGGNALAPLVMGFVLIGIFVTQFVLLLRARQAAPYVQRAGADYQAQYWQYLRQQQYYQQQAGLGPPPPPATPTPPAAAGYAGPAGFGQSAYNAPPAGATPGGAATGWQWPATQAPPPPPPPPSASPPQQGDAAHDQGPPQG